MMNSLGGNGSGNNPAGGNGPYGNGAGGGNGPGNNPNALPSREMQPRDDIMSADSAASQQKLESIRRWINSDVRRTRYSDYNIFSSCMENPGNDLTPVEKESIVSGINAYRFGGEAPNPEKAMIKGTRGPDYDFTYTRNGKDASSAGRISSNVEC